ncbi:MAG: sulfite exporter TauE/SafE family protein [Gaiellaceae bacterium]
MTTSTIVFGIVLGLAAGVLSGLFGVGGGILFVPTLVALGLGQIEAQATSLLAILPTVAVGAANQRRYGNLRLRTAMIVGTASVLGVEFGARIATSLSEATLRRLFAALLFVVAAQLVWRTARARARYPGSS